MSQRLRQSLAEIGWPADADPEFLRPGERPGRVSVMHGSSAEVTWFPSDVTAQLTLFELRKNLNLRPVAGDWVAVHDGDLVRVADRRTTLSRPDPNEKDIQVLAANIDTVLMVLPIDRGLNVKALERLSVMAWDSGAEPVVVLSKADRADDPMVSVEEASAAAPGIAILVTSALGGTGLEDLRARMGPDIASMAEQCRFRDCAHSGDPRLCGRGRCAVGRTPRPPPGQLARNPPRDGLPNARQRSSCDGGTARRVEAGHQGVEDA